MANILLPLLPGQWPVGFCPTDWQSALVTIADNLQAVLANGRSFYNLGDTKPAPEFQNYPWFRTTDGRWYRYEGQWIAPANHDANERRLYIGTTVQLQTYDGGDTSAASDRSGPMWEVDTEFNGRVPIGAGNIPDTDPVRSITVASNVDSAGGFGAWLRTLLRANLPADRLHIASSTDQGEPVTDLGTDDVMLRYSHPSSDAQAYRLAKATGVTEPSVGVTEALGSGTAFVQSPPFRGIYIIKPTSRLYYAIP